tara:strand:+ start:136 stop:531 length:396 start_codon:yes stop_codon:yes gene_type:complete
MEEEEEEENYDDDDDDDLFGDRQHGGGDETQDAATQGDDTESGPRGDEGDDALGGQETQQPWDDEGEGEGEGEGGGESSGAAAGCIVAETQESSQPAAGSVPPPPTLPQGREVRLTGVHPEDVVVAETQLF